MAKKTVAYNPTDRPVVIDDAGHTIPGRAHGDVDRDAAEVARATAAGLLVVPPPSRSGTSSSTSRSSKKEPTAAAEGTTTDRPAEPSEES